jgi:23S rRNA (uracil1939-C5)-methyltransferase
MLQSTIAAIKLRTMSISPLPTEATPWKQGDLIELTIRDLSDRGDGVGRWENRVVFVPDTVPGDRISVRLLYVKPEYAHGKWVELLEPSADRIRPRCIVADKCGGCQWQQVSYAVQRQAKRNQILQALERIGGFAAPEVLELLPMEDDLHYRNKSTYPVGRSDRVIAGYYQKGSHSIVNLNQCPIQDKRLNPLLEAVKQDIQKRQWSIYDEKTHQGNIRHLSLRIGRRTGEMLLTLIAQDRQIPDLWQQATLWMQRFPGLVGVCLNLNAAKTNVIFGKETFCVAGRGHLEEIFAGLTFQMRPDTFFQVYTEQAEALLTWIGEQLQLQGTELLLDAYCGIGTLSLPLAKQVQQVVGIEVQAEAIAQAKYNADRNQITNAEFQIGTVEAILPSFALQPDIVLLDPPRKGCDPIVLDRLRQLHPTRIAYMSCNPATLARDLKILCAENRYQLQLVQPADFFPQTSHIEAAAILQRA